MVFGNAETFAIESAVDDQRLDKNIFFGLFRYWVGGKQLGNWEAGTPLEDIAAGLEWHLNFESDQRDDVFEGMTDKMILERVQSACWATESTLPAYIEGDNVRFEKYCLCPTTSEAFDGWEAVIIQKQVAQRLIWRKRNSGDEVRIQPLNFGEFESVIRLFLKWFQQMQMARSNGN